MEEKTMSKRGLCSDDIMREAIKLIEKKGYDNFSLRELAAKLDVKPASLYNHVHGISEITTSVAIEAADMLNSALSDAVRGKAADEAFLDGTRAYRQFACENYEIYKALIRMPSSDDQNIVKLAFSSYEPLHMVIMSYGAENTATIHYLRSLRSAMHGFIELTQNGFMQHGNVTRDETYEVIIHSFLEILKGLPKV